MFMTARLAAVLFVVSSVPAYCQEGKLALPRSEVNLTLLKSRSVRAALAIAPFQEEELDQLVARQLGDTHMLATINSAAKPEERPGLVAKLREQQAAREQRVYDILLPHQRLRLMQLSMQSLTRPTEATAGLLHQRTIDALGLTEAQLADVKAKASEVEGRLKERIEALKKEIEREKEQARTDALSVLTEDQRKRYQEFFGPIIDFQGNQ